MVFFGLLSKTSLEAKLFHFGGDNLSHTSVIPGSFTQATWSGDALLLASSSDVILVDGGGAKPQSLAFLDVLAGRTVVACTSLFNQ